jgi:hypothetical protein
MRAARAATSPALLGVDQARRNLPGRTFAGNAGVFRRKTQLVALAAGGARWGRFLGRRAAQDWGRRAQRAS